MKFKITYADGTTKEANAELHQGVLCLPTNIPDGYEFYKRRTNPDPFDDDEPEYETKRRTKYRKDYKPFLNRSLLIKNGKLQAAEKVAKKNEFNDYRGWEEYFLRPGENPGGLKIEAI